MPITPIRGKTRIVSDNDVGRVFPKNEIIQLIRNKIDLRLPLNGGEDGPRSRATSSDPSRHRSKHPSKQVYENPSSQTSQTKIIKQWSYKNDSISSTVSEMIDDPSSRAEGREMTGHGLVQPNDQNPNGRRNSLGNKENDPSRPMGPIGTQSSNYQGSTNYNSRVTSTHTHRGSINTSNGKRGSLKVPNDQGGQNPEDSGRTRNHSPSASEFDITDSARPSQIEDQGITNYNSRVASHSHRGSVIGSNGKRGSLKTQNDQQNQEGSTRTMNQSASEFDDPDSSRPLSTNESQSQRGSRSGQPSTSHLNEMDESTTNSMQASTNLSKSYGQVSNGSELTTTRPVGSIKSSRHHDLIASDSNMLNEDHSDTQDPTKMPYVPWAFIILFLWLGGLTYYAIWSTGSTTAPESVSESIYGNYFGCG